MPSLLQESPLSSKQQQTSLQVNPKTGEAFLRLPSPNENIIITPIRPTDADAIVSIMNDERVALKFSFPPYPYLQEHADTYLEAELERHRCALGEGRVFRDCPVQVLREVKEDGEDIFVGEARMTRSKYYEVGDDAESQRLARINYERPVGDPDILWTFMDYLAPSHHGRGIMSSAIKTIIDWAVPNLGVHNIVALAFPTNTASIRVFSKNGFAHRNTLINHKRLSESRGGEMYSVYVTEWKKTVSLIHAP